MNVRYEFDEEAIITRRISIINTHKHSFSVIYSLFILTSTPKWQPQVDPRVGVPMSMSLCDIAVDVYYWLMLLDEDDLDVKDILWLCGIRENK